MQTTTLVGALLALVTFAMPAAGSEMTGPSPAAHEEIAQATVDPPSHPHSWHHRTHGDPSGVRPLITFMLRRRDELGLSTGQAQTLERLRTDFQREAIRRVADLRVAEIDVGTLLNADPVDLGQVEAKLREIERMRTDFTLARIRTIEQGKAQLTPEQRTKLQALLATPRPPHPRAGEFRPPSTRPF